MGWFLAKAQYFDVKHVPWGTPGLSPPCYFSVTLKSINLTVKPIFFIFKSPSQVSCILTLYLMAAYHHPWAAQALLPPQP